MYDLKECVKGNVSFVKYTNKKLYYKCDAGLEFCVPLEDTVNEQGDQPVFLSYDKGILFMRWIRKELQEDKENEK